MKDFFAKAKLVINSKFEALHNELESGLKLVQEKVNGLPVLVSLERVQENDKQFDEKHYFVIPCYLEESKFSLHTMRSLPDGVPEINELPKRRVFHFPNEHWEGTLRQYMLHSARSLSYEEHNERKNPLEKLADDIDALDSKLTYGMLLVGGVAAIFNPLIGAGIAAKAVLPSITGMLSKYGLRPIGEKLTRTQVEERVKEAERHTLNQFSESNTLKVINPILSELEFALRTDESEHDPLSDPNLANAGIRELDGSDWRILTERAIYHVYKDIISDASKHRQAKLGPEDLRWMEILFTGIND